MTSQKFKRKKYFINNDFQPRFIFRFSMTVMLGTLIAGLFFFYSSFFSEVLIFKNLRLQTIPAYQYLLPSIAVGFFSSSILAAVISLLIGIIYSHKISGPMYRFDKVLKEMQKGNLNQNVKIRKNDEFQTMANSLNSTMSSLRVKLADIEESINKLENDMDIKNPLIDKHIKKVREKLTELNY